MIVSHSRRFIFVHLLKTGGTSLTIALDPFLAWNDLVLGGTPRGRALNVPYRERFGLNKHSSVAEIESVCGTELMQTYFVFSLVRRPVDRICSFYNFVARHLGNWAGSKGIGVADIPSYVTRYAGKIEKGSPPTWAAMPAFCASKSFSEFIRYDFADAEKAMQPQVERLSREDGSLTCQTFRLEDQASWIAELQNALGVRFEFPHANVSQAPIVDPSRLDSDDVQFLERTYARDYAAFGY